MMKWMGGWTVDDLLDCPEELVDAIYAEMQAEAEANRRAAPKQR